jgi:hypothetical protein
LARAKHHLDEALDERYIALTLTRTSLLHAKLSGEYLNKAKAEVKRGEWLPVLEKKFGEDKTRSCQLFMEIARRWGELIPELEKNPNLSIDGARQVFWRKWRKDKKPMGEDRTLSAHRSVMRRVTGILQRAWPIWTAEEIGILHGSLVFGFYTLDDYYLDEVLQAWLTEVMKKLRWRVHRISRKLTLEDDRRKRFKPFFSNAELPLHYAPREEEDLPPKLRGR